MTIFKKKKDKSSTEVKAPKPKGPNPKLIIVKGKKLEDFTPDWLRDELNGINYADPTFDKEKAEYHLAAYLEATGKRPTRVTIREDMLKPPFKHYGLESLRVDNDSQMQRLMMRSSAIWAFDSESRFKEPEPEPDEGWTSTELSRIRPALKVTRWQAFESLHNSHARLDRDSLNYQIMYERMLRDTVFDEYRLASTSPQSATTTAWTREMMMRENPPAPNIVPVMSKIAGYLNGENTKVHRDPRRLVYTALMSANDARALHNLVELLKAGIGWFTEDNPNGFIHAFRMPKMFVDNDGRLHRDDAMAVQWEAGGYYFIHGARFQDEKLWKRVVNGKIPAKEILALEDIEQRRAAFQYLPADKFVKDLKAVLVDKSKKGNELYAIRLQSLGLRDSRPTEYGFYIKYTDPSTAREYVSGIDPEIGIKHDADRAMAWKFSLSKKEYLAIKAEG